MGRHLVEVRSLGKVYLPSPWWMRLMLRTAIKSPVVALDDVTFEVNPGEICAVVGPNGAGKSTLFRVLTGLTTPTTGEASIEGSDVTTRLPNVRRIVGFMAADERTLWLRQTCVENLQFHARLQGFTESRISERVDRVLELTGLTEAAHRVGFALSSGMRARLQLARALFHEPRVLILDEPTGAVDPVGSFQLLEIIKQVAREGGLAVLISSHRLDEIEALHDNVLLLNRGRVVYWGDLDTFRARWQRPRVEITFKRDTAATAAAVILGKLDGVEILDAGARALTLVTERTVGEILTSLDGHVEGVETIQRERIRLQELLAKVLGAPEGGEA